MTATVFARPTRTAPGRTDLALMDPGGDDTVPRDRFGRPLIWVPCDECSRSGRVPSRRRPGKTVQCARCRGAGGRERSYTRVTTYIDCLEDRSNLETWGKRMVLIGAAMDPSILNGVLDLDPIIKSDKAQLNRRAEMAATKAGAREKSAKGTELHALSELVDQGQPLPADITFNDVIDMHAYRRATRSFRKIHIEKLVVIDELRIAGTPDRASVWDGWRLDADSGERERIPLVAPSGYTFSERELIITDLKTGTVEHGALKMAMQLAIYARGQLYDHQTKTRTPLANINRDWGVIMNLPAGTGECTLHWVDLALGWQAVQLAGQIRAMRRQGRDALAPFAPCRPAAAANIVDTDGPAV